jgi:uncharacterized protein (TIGR03435 family)
MKSLIRLVVVAAALTATAAHAQTLAGTWQGTLNVGKDLRLVVTITSAAGAQLTGMMYSIDQGGGQGVTVSDITLSGSTVRFAIIAIGGVFDGQLSADATSMRGNWTQGGKPLPLTLTRATPDTAWPIPAPVKPMAADAPTTFEVATVRPSKPDVPGKLFTFKGRQFMTINTSVADLMSFAYGVHARQITAGPEWIGSDKYDVTGQPEAQGQPNERQLRALVRSLLADRFKLEIQQGTKELPVYALTVVPGGSKLSRNDTNPNGLPSLFFKGLGVLPALNASMADFVGVMQAAVLDRPVVDRTGLSGRFDFTLRWTPDDSQFRGLGVRVPAPADDPNAPPGLFTAIQEQLGLRLESTNAPVEVLVISRVERPTDN